jgi:hypothetical protein
MFLFLSITQGEGPSCSAKKWGVILFAVTEFLGTASQVPLLLVIDAT